MVLGKRSERDLANLFSVPDSYNVKSYSYTPATITYIL